MALLDNHRILAVSDVQGNLQSLNELYLKEESKVDLIIHTGNFGFWDNETISLDKKNTFLKQIVVFLNVLEKKVVDDLNNLSTISGGEATSSSSGSANETADFLKSKLLEKENRITQLDLFMSGEYKLPCPVYTLFGPLDDPRIVNSFQKGLSSIPNLYVLDHTKCYEIETPWQHQPNLKLYGIGGSLKIHSLFDHGNLSDEYNDLCGKQGDLWISMLQIATLYYNVMTCKTNKNTVNVFVTHAPVIKSPLLEHLAIITYADFLISQGLHFRYPVMGNGMSFIDSTGGSAGFIDTYRLKFSRLRMILGELWAIVKDNVLDLLDTMTQDNKDELRRSIELGLSLFDKIPVATNGPNETFVPLTLNPDPSASAPDHNTDTSLENTGSKEDPDISKQISKKVNDLYYAAYYNLWHFNLCDVITKQPHQDEDWGYNYVVLAFDRLGNMRLDRCTSQGFNFEFKMKEGEVEHKVRNHVSTRHNNPHKVSLPFIDQYEEDEDDEDVIEETHDSPIPKDTADDETMVNTSRDEDNSGNKAQNSGLTSSHRLRGGRNLKARGKAKGKLQARKST